MEYYSAMKRNEVLTRDDRWMVSEKHCAKGSSQIPPHSPAKKKSARKVFIAFLKIPELSNLWKSSRTMALEELSFTMSHSTDFY